MARKLKRFDFPNMGGTGVGKYPWDDWLDGNIWELARGVDYVTTSLNFRTFAYVVANKRGGKLRTSMTDERIVIQFVLPD